MHVIIIIIIIHNIISSGKISDSSFVSIWHSLLLALAVVVNLILPLHSPSRYRKAKEYSANQRELTRVLSLPEPLTDNLSVNLLNLPPYFLRRLSPSLRRNH